MSDPTPNNPAQEPAAADPQPGLDPADGAVVPPARDGGHGDSFGESSTSSQPKAFDASDAARPSSSPSYSRPAAYEPASLRHVDWPAAFPFVHLFKGFRVAVHPSKLILALAGVLLLYTGGRALDGLWPDRHQAVPNEAAAFDAHLTGAADAAGRGADLPPDAGAPSRFAEVRDAARAQRDARALALRREAALFRNAEIEQVDLGDAIDLIRNDRNISIEAANAAYAAAPNVPGAEARRDAAVAGAFDAAAARAREVDALRGKGLFIEFYQYEVAALESALTGLLRLEILGPAGFLSGLYRFLVVGPLWAFSQHPLYFTLLSLWALVLLAVFGGAITRIACVQVARDEKISLRSALRFSTSKFVSFASAPLIPLLIVAVVGLAIAAAGALGNIPVVGEIVVAVAFILALLGGFLIALVLIGLVGGFTLMYPTVAAEGTDSFDAISRSFSYVYAKPWRLGFLAVVAMAYAAATYLFVRLFLWLVLVCSHTAAGLFIFRDVAGGRNLLSALWPAPPSFTRLSYDIPFINLTTSQDIAAGILAFWVYLVIALLAAYAASLYFSLGTIIYYLMRREVDATELEEVYLDPADEEYGTYADAPDADNAPGPVEPTPV